MNLSNLSNRIEIAFWIGLVALLRNRRVTRLSLLGLVGVLLLVTLTLTGFTWAFTNRSDRLLTHKVTAIQNPAHLIRPDNGQKNLLLIVVDELSGNELSLLGAWMLINAPSGQKVTFMPIYPSGSETAEDLGQAFSQTKGSLSSGAFLRLLEARGLWWDNYLIIDQAGLAALVDLSGGIDIGSIRSNGEQVVGLLSIAGQDDQTAQDFQARLAQGICQRLNTTLKNASILVIIETLTGSAAQGKAHSDLAPEDLQASWSRMQAAGGLSCEFPTLIGR